jgi:hypothetical protein
MVVAEAGGESARSEPAIVVPAECHTPHHTDKDSSRCVRPGQPDIVEPTSFSRSC